MAKNTEKEATACFNLGILLPSSHLIKINFD